MSHTDVDHVPCIISISYIIIIHLSSIFMSFFSPHTAATLILNLSRGLLAVHVSTHVFAAVTAVREGGPTHVTWVGPLPSVGAHVEFQVVGSFEDFAAGATRVGLYPTACST